MMEKMMNKKRPLILVSLIFVLLAMTCLAVLSAHGEVTRYEVEGDAVLLPLSQTESADLTNAKGFSFIVDTAIGTDTAFSLEIADYSTPTTVFTAAGTGSVLLVPSNGGVTYWREQTIPADFVGEVYIPYTKGVASTTWRVHNNPVFAGTGDLTKNAMPNAKLKTTGVTAAVAAQCLSGFATVDAAGEETFKKKTTLTTAQLSAAAVAQSLASMNEQAYTDMTLFEFDPAQTWGNVIIPLDASTDDSYALALRVKNFSTGAYALQINFTANGIETGIRWSSDNFTAAENDAYHYNVVSVDGSIGKAYYGYTSGYGSFAQHISIPAGTDGTLIIPWSMLMGARGSTTPTGRISGTATKLQFSFRNTDAWSSAQRLLVGNVSFIKDDGSILAAKDLGLGSATATYSGWTPTKVSYKLYRISSDVSYTVNGSDSNNTATLSNSGEILHGKTVRVVPAPDYTVSAVTVNGAALTAENGVYSFVVADTSDSYAVAITTTYSEGASQGYQVYNNGVVLPLSGTAADSGIDISAVSAFKFDVTDTAPADIPFTLTIHNAASLAAYTASGAGSILLVPSSGAAYWRAQTIPAGFIGTVVVPLSVGSTATNTYIHNNPVFASGTTLPGAVDAELFIGAGTGANALSGILSAATCLTAAELTDYKKQTVLTSADVLGNGTLTGNLAAGNLKTGTDLTAIYFAEDSSWSSIAFATDQSAASTIGLSLRITNLSNSVLPLQFTLKNDGTETSIRQNANYADDTSHYYSFYNLDGTVTKVYYGNNSGYGLYTQYISLPANADGTLIIPWSMFMGYRTGTSTGRIDGTISEIKMLFRNAATYPGSQAQEMAVGQASLIKDDFSLLSLIDLGKGSRDAGYTGWTNGTGAAAVKYTAYYQSALLDLTVNENASDTTAYLLAGSGAFGSAVTILAAEDYIIKAVTVNGQALTESYGAYSFTPHRDVYSYTILVETEYVGQQSYDYTYEFKDGKLLLPIPAGYVAGDAADISTFKGISFTIDTALGEDTAFSLEIIDASDSGTVWAAKQTGSILLVASGSTVYWHAQVIPADFVGTVYVPLSIGTATYSYQINNPAFKLQSGSGTGLPALIHKYILLSGLTTDDTHALGEAVNHFECLTAAQFAEIEQMTVITTEEASKDTLSVSLGSMAAQILDNMSVLYFDHTDSAWGTLTVDLDSNAADTRGLALRIKNLSGSSYPLQMMLIQNGVELATRQAANYSSDQSYYFSFYNVGGAVSKVYYGNNSGGGSYSQYMTIPANADGVLVIPWSMIMGYRMGNDPNGRIDSSITAIRFVFRNAAAYAGSQSQELAVGVLSFIKANNTLLSVKDLGKSSADLAYVGFAGGTGAAAVKYALYKASAAVTLSVNGSLTDTTATIASNTPAYNSYVLISPQAGYQIDSVTVNGVLLTASYGTYSFMVVRGVDLYEVEAETSERVIPLHIKRVEFPSDYLNNNGQLILAGAASLTIDVDNSTGADLYFVVLFYDAGNGTIFKAENTGSILLLDDDASYPYWREQMIPAGFKGTVLIPLSLYSTTLYAVNNPVFTGGSTFPDAIEGYIDLIAVDEQTDISGIFDNVLVYDKEDTFAMEKELIETLEDLFYSDKAASSVETLLAQTAENMSLIYFDTIADPAALGTYSIDLTEVAEAGALPDDAVAFVLRIKNTSRFNFNWQPIFESNGYRYTMRFSGMGLDDGSVFCYYMDADGVLTKIYLRELTQDYLVIPPESDGILILPLAFVRFTAPGGTTGAQSAGLITGITGIKGWFMNNTGERMQQELGVGLFGAIGANGTFTKLFDFGSDEDAAIVNAEGFINGAQIIKMPTANITFKVNSSDSDTTAAISQIGVVPYASTLEISVAEGYEIISVTANGKAVPISEGKYLYKTTKIDRNVEILVTTQKIEEEEPIGETGCQGCNSSSIGFAGFVVIPLLALAVLLIRKRRKIKE